jgi:O-antigen ligase
MGAKSNLNEKQFELSNWLFTTTLLVTISFNSKITDPFNSPKFWVLMLCAATLSGPILTKKIELNENEKRFYLILKGTAFLFLGAALVSSLMSNNVHTSIFGENFRRNGLLTIVAFLIVYFGAIKFVKFKNTGKFFKTVLYTSIIVGGYSVLQITKNDFISWSNPNAIITTLGNTNYAGATMSILAILCFGQLFISDTNLYRRISLSGILIVLLVAIRATQARQALIILFIGCGIIILSVIYKKYMNLGKLLMIISGPLALFSILGMLQIGPLQDLLYKGSLSIRGYYWRAGFEMFLANPIFGVGIDNYGKFFKEVREVNYPLNYGFSITSTNAHNIFIQYFSTGGIIVGFAYLILQIIVLQRSLTLIRKTIGEERMIAITFFAAWIAFQAQSLISIENIGGSIWGWLLGGSLIGLSLQTHANTNIKNNSVKKSIELDWKAIIPSTVISLIVAILVVQLYNGERNTYLSQSYAAPQSTDPKVREYFNVYSSRALKSNFIDNDYKNIVLSTMFEMGYREQALEQLKKIHNDDPRNLDTLLLLALGHEQTREFALAVEYRKELAKYDPWGAQNYLALGIVYKYIEDYDSMQSMLEKIISFAPSDPIATEAKNTLVIPIK